MNAQELDEAYTRLCRGLGDAPQEEVARRLARLTLLLMREVGDPERVRAAVDAALA
jgi:hypothetical protein